MIKLVIHGIIFGVVAKLLSLQHEGVMFYNTLIGFTMILGLLYIYVEGKSDDKGFFLSERDFLANVVISTLVSSRLGDISLSPMEYLGIFAIVYIYIVRYLIIFREEVGRKIADF